jgi:carboxymethylenebutenolidase
MSEIETEQVAFAANGTRAGGYLAKPEGEGPFAGVVVVQEWWGLDEHIKDVARRFAAEGFAALAPDLYHGKVASEPDEAMKLRMAMDAGRAARELVGAAEYLASQPYLRGRKIGSIGFCMGGGLALTLACDSEHVGAAAPFYGGNPDPIDKVADLRGPLLVVHAEHDERVNAGREPLRRALERHGKRFEIQVYPGTHHAFFNDTRAGIYDAAAAADAWQRVLALFRENL